MSRSGLSWLQLTVVENGNVTGKLSSWRDVLDVRVFGSREYSGTLSAKNNASVVLLTWGALMEFTFV